MARTKQTARRPSILTPSIYIRMNEEPYGFEPTITCQYMGCCNLVLTGFVVCGQCTDQSTVTPPMIVPTLLQRIISSWPIPSSSSLPLIASDPSIPSAPFVTPIIPDGWTKCLSASCSVFIEGGGLCSVCEDERIKALDKRKQQQSSQHIRNQYERVNGKHSRPTAIRYNTYNPMPSYYQRKKMTKTQLIRTTIRCKSILHLDKKHDRVRL